MAAVHVCSLRVEPFFFFVIAEGKLLRPVVMLQFALGNDKVKK